jgi:RNA polymerase sigma-70 factor (ECF subfamily)
MTVSMKNRQFDAPQAIQAEALQSEFETLFTQHWASVYRLLRRLVGDPAEAEDLALETFVRLYQRPPLPGHEFNPAGWLHRVATNLGLHSIRSFQRRERYELAAGKNALEEAPESSPAQILAQEEDRRLTRTVLAQMNERQAQLLIMRYSGMAYRDIARALRLSPTSIGPLLLRAEREFEKRYQALAQEE